MNSHSHQVEVKHVVKVNWADRWEVYRRLQELDIPCWCESNQPLTVEIVSPAVVVQLGSVMRQYTESRRNLICTLNRCWRHRP